MASDTNKYIHVRVAYDPAGNNKVLTLSVVRFFFSLQSMILLFVQADATIGSADDDGIAEVDATPQMKVEYYLFVSRVEHEFVKIVSLSILINKIKNFTRSPCVAFSRTRRPPTPSPTSTRTSSLSRSASNARSSCRCRSMSPSMACALRRRIATQCTRHRSGDRKKKLL